MAKRKDLFSVAQRIVPAHGVKVGCSTHFVANGLLRSEADELADTLQKRNPDEEYAVVRLVFCRWTRGEKS